MHQGDAYVQKKNEQRILQLATFDTQDRLPSQIWYDQLREHDDGSFSRTTCMNPDKNVDHLTAMPKYGNIVKAKVLSPRLSQM